MTIQNCVKKVDKCINLVYRIGNYKLLTNLLYNTYGLINFIIFKISFEKVRIIELFRRDVNN